MINSLQTVTNISRLNDSLIEDRSGRLINRENVARSHEHKYFENQT